MEPEERLEENLPPRPCGSGAVVRPIDMGCGTLFPMRSSNLAFVAKFDYSRNGRVRIEEKAFATFTITATTAGYWRFHGKSGLQDITAGMVISGKPGAGYGCAHTDEAPNSGIVAALRNFALDDEAGPIFEKQTLRLPDIAPALIRAIGSVNDDDFESQIFEIFHGFSRQSLHDDKAVRGSGVRMQRAKRFIEQNALEDLTLKDIADSVGLNPFVCVRQFKEATGITPYAYLVNRRMLEAKRLLRDTELSVEDVAKSTGYKDCSYFCRFFKRSTGVTPTQYRVG